jgi:tetratricopeptide (TPR) repeat protein
VIKMNSGDLRVAGEYFERALQYTPDYSYLHVNIAVLKAALGQRTEADRQFREALRDDPGNPIAYTYYARWLKSMGRTVEARLYASRAVELSPADIDARVLLDDLTVAGRQ